MGGLTLCILRDSESTNENPMRCLSHLPPPNPQKNQQFANENRTARDVHNSRSISTDTNSAGRLEPDLRPRAGQDRPGGQAGDEELPERQGRTKPAGSAFPATMHHCVAFATIHMTYGPNVNREFVPHSTTRPSQIPPSIATPRKTAATAAGVPEGGHHRPGPAAPPRRPE